MAHGMGVGQGKEPLAYAKIATKGDAIPPFYITDHYVKEVDDSGTPKRIEVILGRSPQPGGPSMMFDADFHIGNRMKISKKHAMIYWNAETQHFEVKSICKNAVKVNGQSYVGSSDGHAGQACQLTSQACIQIADGTALYFLLPKVRTTDKPKLTYEQLIMSVLEPDKELLYAEVVNQIQQKYAYYSDDSIGENHPWKGSLRTTLSIKTKAFRKLVKIDPATNRKATYWTIATAANEAEDAAGGDNMQDESHELGGEGEQELHTVSVGLQDGED